MSQTIEVDSLLRLDIKPGETLVIVLPDDMGEQEFQHTAELIRDRWSDVDYKVMVVNSRVDLKVAETRALEEITSQVVGPFSVQLQPKE